MKGNSMVYRFFGVGKRSDDKIIFTCWRYYKKWINSKIWNSSKKKMFKNIILGRLSYYNRIYC
jgi:hypothetical protein